MNHPAQTARPPRKPKPVRAPFIPHWERMRDEFDLPAKPAQPETKPEEPDKLVISAGDAEKLRA